MKNIMAEAAITFKTLHIIKVAYIYWHIYQDHLASTAVELQAISYCTQILQLRLSNPTYTTAITKISYQVHATDRRNQKTSCVSMSTAQCCLLLYQHHISKTPNIGLSHQFDNTGRRGVGMKRKKRVKTFLMELGLFL